MEEEKKKLISKGRMPQNKVPSVMEIMKNLMADTYTAHEGKKLTCKELLCRRIIKNGMNGSHSAIDYAFKAIGEAPVEQVSLNAMNSTPIYFFSRTLPQKKNKKKKKWKGSLM